MIHGVDMEAISARARSVTRMAELVESLDRARELIDSCGAITNEEFECALMTLAAHSYSCRVVSPRRGNEFLIFARQAYEAAQLASLTESMMTIADTRFGAVEKG